MKELGRYCTETQMFVREPVDPDMKHLQFLRDLAEKNKFGHKPLSVPMGDNLLRLPYKDVAKYALQQGDGMPDQKLRQHMAASGDY